jgi:hypothetical protein
MSTNDGPDMLVWSFVTGLPTNRPKHLSDLRVVQVTYHLSTMRRFLGTYKCCHFTHGAASGLISGGLFCFKGNHQNSMRVRQPTEWHDLPHRHRHRLRLFLLSTMQDPSAISSTSSLPVDPVSPTNINAEYSNTSSRICFGICIDGVGGGFRPRVLNNYH